MNAQRAATSDSADQLDARTSPQDGLVEHDPRRNVPRARAGTKRSRTRSHHSQLSALLASEMGHLLDAIPDGVVIADDSGAIQFVNDQTQTLFGYEREALLGQPVELLMPERFRGVHVLHRADYAAEPHLRPMGSGLRLFGRRQDGTELPIEVSLSPITVAGSSLVLSTIRDVTQRLLLEWRTHELLKTRLAMLQAVLDELPVSVYLARGHDAELVLANRQVAGVWGAEWQEGQSMGAFLAASGARVLDAQGREQPLERLATLRALRGGQSVRQHQEVVRRRDGSSLSVLVNAVALDPDVFPILSSMSRINGMDGSGDHQARRDVPGTMRDAVNDPLAPVPLVLVVHQDVGALIEAEQLKDEFVAMAAHELRAPVASLLGYAQLLVQAAGSRSRTSPRRTQDTHSEIAAEASARPRSNAHARAIPREWREEAATAVMESSRRLASLTDDLLDATRLQANRLELRPELLELGALVRRVVKRTQVTTRRHTIDATIPGELLMVEADILRIEQVLSNLLSNAIKYSPDGGSIGVEVMLEMIRVASASVDARVEKLAADDLVDGPAPEQQPAARFPVMARVAIHDQGMGIPVDQQSRIFERFGRADNARESGIAGTGLGLYLCRELIERQGGRLWFSSREGAGTTFTFELPGWIEPQ